MYIYKGENTSHVIRDKEPHLATSAPTFLYFLLMFKGLSDYGPSHHFGQLIVFNI